MSERHPEVLGPPAAFSPARALSFREAQIVWLAAEGLTDKEICRSLSITRSTVSTYWKRIRDKLGAVTRANAIALMSSIELDGPRRMVQCAVGYAIFSLDLDGVIATWNPGVKTVLGYDKDEWIGLSVEATFTLEDQALGLPAREASLALAHGAVNVSRWVARVDGQLVWVFGMVFPLLDETDRTVGLVAVLREDEERRGQSARDAELIEELSERLDHMEPYEGY